MSSDVSKIQNYRIIRKLSESSAFVYLVERDGIEYALKILKSADSDAVTRFRRESATLARIKHENLVKLFDIGESDEGPFLVMEFLRGFTIEEYLKTNKYSNELALETVISIVKALSELHSNNLVHRDVKPSNVFIEQTGAIKLIDLGLVGDVEQIKEEKSLVGTPLFCSPEQSRILKVPVDFRSDLYSLGVLFFNMIAGRPPFVGTHTEILQLHASHTAPDVRDFNPSASPAIAFIITKLLLKDPDDRYQATAGLLADLKNIAEIEAQIKSGLKPKLDGSKRLTKTNKVAFVERKKELERLINSWQTVLSTQSGIVTVSGPSGSGKTRLCKEFIENIRTANTVYLQSKCQIFDRELPLGPIREAVENLIEEVEALDGDEQRKQMSLIRQAAAGIESELAKLSRSMRRVLNVKNDQKINQNLDGDREVFFAKIAEFFLNLSGTSQHNMIFFIDDLQWLDSSSLQILNIILTGVETRKLLVLGTARDDHESKENIDQIEFKLGTSALDHIPVAPLNNSQMVDLIHNYLGAQNISAEIANSISQASEGNPLIAIEYLRAGMEQGFLSIRDNQWILIKSHLDKIRLSNDVYSLILSRLEKSSTQSKNFLQAAALFGNIFKKNDIANICNLNFTEADSILAECEEIGLIEKMSSIKWKFIHDKIPESLVTSLNENEKELLSEKIASYYFNKSDVTPEEIFATARLYVVASQSASATNACSAQMAAGNLAMDSYAYDEAYKYFKYSFIHSEKIIELKKSRAKIAADLAVCAQMFQDNKLALEAIDFALAEAANPVDLAHLTAVKTWIFINQSSFVESWELFKKASLMIGHHHPIYLHWKILQIIWTWAMTFVLDFIPIRIPAALYFSNKEVNIEKIANMYRDSAFCAELNGNFLDLILVSMKLLVLGKLVGGPNERAVGYACVGYVYGLLGLKSLASTYADKATIQMEVLNNPAVSAYCEMRRLFSHTYSGITKDYYESYAKKRPFLKKYLSPSEMCRLEYLSSFFYNFRGLHKEALDLSNEVVLAHRQGTLRVPKHSLVGQLNLAWAQLTILGRAQEAIPVKAAALKVNILARFSSPSMRSAMNAEVMARRVTQEIDQSSDEIVTSLWKRSPSRLADPLTKNILAMAGFIILYQLEITKSFNERMSLRRDLRALLRLLSTTLYCPLFRSNYYLLKAGYFRIDNKLSLAKENLDIAETLASESGSLRVLFDIQRERARICLTNDNQELAKMHVISALTLAVDHGWKVNRDQIITEFENCIDERWLSGLSGASRHSGATHTIMASPTVNGKTIAVRENRILASHTASSTKNKTINAVTNSNVNFGDRAFLRDINIEGARIVEGILNVSEAFITSLNFEAQSRAILTELIKTFAAERGFIFFIDNETQEISSTTSLNSDGTAASNNSYSSTVVKKALKEKIAVVLSGKDEAEAMASKSAVLHNLRSIMATPLIVKDRLLGVVYLDSTLAKGLFSKGDVDLLATMAHQISIAFELTRIAQVEVEKANLQKEFDIQSAVTIEAKKVAIMVDNMRQALFTISEDGTIEEPVSKYAETFFGRDIIGAKVYDILFHEQTTELVDQVRSSVIAVFGEDELQWSLADNFPRKIIVNDNSSVSAMNQRSLKISPAPIWNQIGLLDKILFIVEDVTDQEKAEIRLKEAKESSEALSQILENEISPLRKFLQVSQIMLQSAMKDATLLNTLTITPLLRDLHTLKGNSRLYKLKLLSEQVHTSESNLAEALLLKNQESLKIAVEQELSIIYRVLSKYYDLFNRVFSHNENGNKIESNALHDYFKNELLTIASTAPLEVSRRIHSCLEKMSLKPVHLELNSFHAMVNEIAARLEKKARVEVLGEAWLSAEQLDGLQECLIHLVRNSLDHGLETENERAAQGKNPMGTISFHLNSAADGIRIAVADDGRGIDAQKIYQIALKKGIIQNSSESWTLEEKMNLIFQPNFSTKDVVTDISGRGVGMDAVKHAIEALDGSVSLKSELGKGSTFTIFFPRILNKLAS